MDVHFLASIDFNGGYFLKHQKQKASEKTEA